MAKAWPFHNRGFCEERIKKARRGRRGSVALWVDTRRTSRTPGLKPMRAGAQGFRVELPPQLSIDRLPAASPPRGW
jgi:hypothetical protein